jgi:lipopolysaccharide/colanic/teichoic acid biosynthesis glycosyltransferase
MATVVSRLDILRTELRAPETTWILARPRVALFRPGYQRAKRVLDLGLCVAVLPAAAGLMALCAFLVWLDDGGPVVFRQMRTGRGGRRFRMYKFRTMVRNATELKQELLHLNEHSGPDFKLSEDPRVTRIGKFLRKSSLDELPQIWNVLKGDMSLVGPRPTSFPMDTYSLWQTERLEVLPGITGLAQINGRSSVTFDKIVRYDIEYIENRSMRLDLQILWKTATSVVAGKGAH